MTRLDTQRVVAQWCQESFGQEHSNNLHVRGLRLAEEALEAAQACGCPVDKVHALVDYVFGRPVGELSQEIGGVSLTLLALANAAGLEAEVEEKRELDRVLAKPRSFFAERNAKKDALGFGIPTDQQQLLAQQPSSSQPDADLTIAEVPREASP